ncbi:hypothetical protein DEH69_05035 [Streptomyces sp. PT12]|nr:hypothetical protein DEH69_05035 [Streptomyces sp. PT12]
MLNPHVLAIRGYEGGPLADGSAYLDDPLCWPVHLGTCLRGDDAQRAAFGADPDAAMELYGAGGASVQRGLALFLHEHRDPPGGPVEPGDLFTGRGVHIQAVMAEALPRGDR